MARRKSDDAGGGYNWMDTYGDMVTLLLTFFVMLFSMSSIDEKKWKTLVVAFSNGQNTTSEMQQVVMPGNGEDTGKPSPAEGEYEFTSKEEIDITKERPISLTELYDYLKAYIEQEGMQGSVSIEKDAADNVTLRFDNNIFFSGDSATLRTESHGILDFIGECLLGIEDQVLVTRVNGHTASVPIANYPVNDWRLSAERATEVVIYFEEQCGLDPTKLMANGWGKNQPRNSNDTADNRAKNRRVEISIIGNKLDMTDADQLAKLVNDMMGGSLLPELDPKNPTQAVKDDMAAPPGEAASRKNASASSGSTVSGTSQSGASQSDVSQSDVSQSGASQSGASQSGASQSAMQPDTASVSGALSQSAPPGSAAAP